CDQFPAAFLLHPNASRAVVATNLLSVGSECDLRGGQRGYYRRVSIDTYLHLVHVKGLVLDSTGLETLSLRVWSAGSVDSRVIIGKVLLEKAGVVFHVRL